jgi:thiamine biosynthesis lipoprotein
MRIGLGGIAQGFGADCAMKAMMDLGVEHALVNVSGDIKALGTKFGEPWEIAIVHPRDKERVIAVIPVSNTCLITSGDYERGFEIDGRRYHHILDPRTGRPSTGCMSATVLAPDAALADALATGLCVMGPEKGLALVERLPRVEALLVDAAGVVHASSGLRTRVR